MQTMQRGRLRLIVTRRRTRLWAGYVAAQATFGVDELVVATGLVGFLIIQILLLV
jgi:hypothetical protein